jgi:hypothetical protein
MGGASCGLVDTTNRRGWPTRSIDTVRIERSSRVVSKFVTERSTRGCSAGPSAARRIGCRRNSLPRSEPVRPGGGARARNPTPYAAHTRSGPGPAARVKSWGGNSFTTVKIIPPPGRLRPLRRLRRSRGGGLYAKAQSKKVGRMYVHHVRKPTYTGLSRALWWMKQSSNIFNLELHQQSSWRSSCCSENTKRSTTGSLARTGSQAPAQGLLQRTVDLLNFSCHCIGVIPACQCLSNAFCCFGYCSLCCNL